MAQRERARKKKLSAPRKIWAKVRGLPLQTPAGGTLQSRLKNWREPGSWERNPGLGVLQFGHCGTVGGGGRGGGGGKRGEMGKVARSE